jgi:hypothetical protein
VSHFSAWDKVKRARAGVKAAYGDDSSQFEMIGGTRTSDRKTRSRKVTSLATRNLPENGEVLFMKNYLTV